MTDQLDLHPASAEERTQAFRNVHDVWPSAPDPEEHLRIRLTNPKVDNATWYVGTLGTRVVAACGCYHVSARIDGAIEPACAVGSVHTLPEFRGRGFAPRLLAFAEDQERAAGKTFSLLYSDIGPEYYARLGYRRCAAAHGWANPSHFQSTASAPCRLVAFPPKDNLSALADLYARDHARHALSIARSPGYWRYLLTQSPQDEFYFVEIDGSRAGYVRLGIKLPLIVIRDLSLAEVTADAERGVYSAVIALAKSRGAERVGGWMPGDAVCRELFEVADRVQELTMIKPLVGRIRIDERHCAAADYLHEIDHV